MTVKSTRDHIVEAADRLFYRQGYEHTSFSDIAGAVRISRGNFYYHFKTKGEILDAVIEARLEQTRLMLEGWETEGKTPADRIRSFIRILVANRIDIKRFGCPVGTLSSELAKLSHDSRAEANGLFMLFRTWLRRQFTLLGRKADADALAMHLLAMSQGVATLANAFHDDTFIQREVQQMCDWLDAQADADANGDARQNARAKTDPEMRMFIVLLRLSGNRDKAGQFMDGHNAWIRRGFDDGVFLMVGSLRPHLGGAILANNTTLADLQKRVNDDPFVAEKIVSAEILDITPSRTDDRLAFLLS